MSNPRKYTTPDKGDWPRKDFLIWGLTLTAALLALLALWTPLMLAPLTEMAGAFLRLASPPA
ncbi:MAG: hypothetical protein IDH49_03100 [Gammaproteobacteria bacterium]|nr:hypothetical protein [Gammaproteobacteria bacterium]